MKINFITSNGGKFKEVKDYLERRGIECQWLKESYEEIQADTTEEISSNSAKKLSFKLKDKFFIDDTGLYIESLKGFPGPYSSYILKTIGNTGILELLKNKDRKAYFLTVISYFDGKCIRSYSGRVDGVISETPTGTNGFGYDPIFIPSDSKISLAEMTLEGKNNHSHRIKALKLFLKDLGLED
jgi:XTP/dITP diphosphohydrolase